MAPRAKRLGVLTLLAIAVAGATWSVRSHRAELQQPRDLHGSGFVTSVRCAHCHEEHAESWAATYHRTMTQEASAESVLAPFAGEQVEYRGWRATMLRAGENFVMRVTAPDGETTDQTVDRTVGSHRYQQYLGQDGDEYHRLPWAWHVAEQRWFHMNGAFLTPDPEGEATQVDYERHVVRWNDNCVFCHNVSPNPGLGPHGFDTEVAELGIACEACHGPGQEHAARNTSPVRRYTLHTGEDADPTIISPARLTPERSADVCGRCHGQRMTGTIETFMQEGDPFVPGDDLAHYSEPLWADTTLRGAAVFGTRFWADGSPRLTAYEYQGWLQAACTLGGELTCTTCHGMHEGDPSGQLRPADSSSFERAATSPELADRSCTECHSLAPSHAGDGHAEVSCVSCHMPRIVYGVLDSHRTHRIEVPVPSLHDAHRRPHACGLCHLDEDAAFFGGVADGVPVGLRWLFAGDPITRALSADAYGRSEGEARALGALLAALERETYPAVRRLAWRALRRLRPELRVDDYDPMDALPARRRSIAALEFAAEFPEPALLDRLEAQAAHVNIEIGE